MNFVHSLRAPRAPAEGSMERGHNHGFSPSAGAAPCADCIGYPHRSAAAGQKRRNEEEVRHTFRVPIITSRLSPEARRRATPQSEPPPTNRAISFIPNTSMNGNPAITWRGSSTRKSCCRPTPRRNTVTGRRSGTRWMLPRRKPRRKPPGASS